MCGICGFVGLEDKKTLKSMSDCIAYRGPDDQGHFSDDGVGLANRRLSIIDIEGGHQPMNSADGRFVLVYNGELYNFQTLRAHLEKYYRFSTRSDTEVILHAFELWGPRCVEKFNGMFAFAIWDTDKRELFLARDRLGIKPLYYTQVGNQFVFGSEVKCILQHPHVKRTLNAFAAHQLLNLSAIVSQDTMFKGIYKLLPGRTLIFNAATASISIARYWSPVFREVHTSLDAAAKTFRKTFFKAVHRQMVSDVPLGALLSGGLDSTSIVAAMMQSSDLPVKTFTMGFGGSSDELDDARHVADSLGTEHTEFVIDPQDAFSAYPQLIWHLDQPKVNNIYSYFVYKKVRQSAKVCLSGLGGDELLGGYVSRHRQIEAVKTYRRWTPNAIQRFLASASKAASEALDKGKHPTWSRMKKYLGFFQHAKDGARFYLNVGGQLLDSQSLRQVYGPSLDNQKTEAIVTLFEEYFSELNPQQAFLNAEIQTSLPDDLLITEDAMSMAHSLEVRVPFLDNELLEFSLSLPFEHKYKNGVGKIVLRKALKDSLPKAVMQTPKAGFGPKLMEWYQRGVRPLAEQVLDDPQICRDGLIQRQYIQQVLSKPMNQRLARHYAMMEALTGLEIWYQTYMGETMTPKKVA